MKEDELIFLRSDERNGRKLVDKIARVENCGLAYHYGKVTGEVFGIGVTLAAFRIVSSHEILPRCSACRKVHTNDVESVARAVGERPELNVRYRTDRILISRGRIFCRGGFSVNRTRYALKLARQRLDCGKRITQTAVILEISEKQKHETVIDKSVFIEFFNFDFLVRPLNKLFGAFVVLIESDGAFRRRSLVIYGGGVRRS